METNRGDVERSPAPRSIARPLEHPLGLALLATIVAAPIAWAAGYSALYSVGAIGLLSDGVTWRHWQAALAAGGLGSSVAYSVTIATASTTMAYVTALVVTLATPQSRHSWLRLGLLAVPLATPAAVAAMLAYQLLNPGGVAARAAAALGAIDSPSQFPALVNDRWSAGLIAAQAATTLPLLIFFLFKTWTSARVDRYCRLAESLGASVWTARRTVALPMLVHRSRPLFLFSFLVNLGAYELPLVLGRQAPQMFSVLTERRFGQFDLAQRPQAFALTIVYLALVSAGVVILTVWRRRP